MYCGRAAGQDAVKCGGKKGTHEKDLSSSHSNIKQAAFLGNFIVRFGEIKWIDVVLDYYVCIGHQSLLVQAHEARTAWQEDNGPLEPLGRMYGRDSNFL